MDCANWYGVTAPSGKQKQALYPAMGRAHINFLGENKLVFDGEPRVLFKTINYAYTVIGTRVFQIDTFFNTKEIGTVSLTGDLWFAFLPVGTVVYALLTDNTNIYVITEDGTSVTYAAVTDPNRPTKPEYVAAFGNRFVVSQKDTPLYYLSQINLGGIPLNLFTCFTVAPFAALFNRASGIIRQMAVLHNQLYIFSDYTADVWANIPTQITISSVTDEFPWKLNTSYNWDYGMADPYSLAVSFGRMVWLAKNANGFVSFMVSDGQQPQDISTQAVNVLLEKTTSAAGDDPRLLVTFRAFLYQYESSIFYRVSYGDYTGTQILDSDTVQTAIEFNFEINEWARVIELNGERNRIQRHVFYSNKHLVTVQDDDAIYQMAGNIYRNELRTPDTTAQAANAFTKYPMRYELVTQQIFQPDYSEFIDDYVEIDFVFGEQTFYQSEAPFDNTVYLVTEESTPDAPVYITAEGSTSSSPIFLIAEGSNTPSFDDNHYNALFKPHIELYYSDDGGVTFNSAWIPEFSPLGQFRWRMRWYELGASRNRCYKLVCVSSAPIVILGAVRNTRRVSGGAN